MPDDPQAQEPATMQSMLTRIMSARPNTIIGGSAIGTGGGTPIGDGPATSTTQEPRKAE